MPREGPTITIKASCFGCQHEHTTRETVEDGNDCDTSHNTHCYQDQRNVRPVDPDWRTPKWCPFLAAAMAAAVAKAL